MTDSPTPDPFATDTDSPAYRRWQEMPPIPHEETIGTRRGFDGGLLHVRVDDVRLPSGTHSTREVVTHPGSVVIIPVTTDGDVLLIRQWRHVTGRYQIELPAGHIDPGEHFLTSAGRELIEETGHTAGKLRHLTTVFMSPGYTEERTAFVLATGCTPIAHEADQDEPIEVIRFALDELPTLLTPGDTAIENAQTMLGVLWLLRLQAHGEL